jgi:hypothetical protein
MTEHNVKYTFVGLSYSYATFKHALQDKNLHTHTMLNECKMCEINTVHRILWIIKVAALNKCNHNTLHMGQRE